MIEKIFVLMLENRSFDHMLGLSGISGIDGIYDASGNIKPSCFNVNGISGRTVPASDSAPDPIEKDPPHEFCDVLMQLCGSTATSMGGQYPIINNSGFIDSFSGNFGYPGIQEFQCQKIAHENPTNPDEIMQCFKPNKVSALYTLAKEYAVCDRWFSSMPGPTWPNRYFAHAASSAGLDDSPSKAEVMHAYAFGQRFDNGTIFDRLNKHNIPWEIFAGDHLPQSFALSGMTKEFFGGRFPMFESFEKKLQDENYEPQYIFIEPKWGKLQGNDAFTGGNSQHPIDGIAGGEQLIRDVYRTIRKSPHWEKSMLIITYDEHGGFYDHVSPPNAVPPEDSAIPSSNIKHGFDFSVLGVRVPAVIVSPWIARGTVDHIRYDHSSIPATLGKLFNMDPLTWRDRSANDLLHLLTDQCRKDEVELLDMWDEDALDQSSNIDALEENAPIKPITQGFLNVAILKHQAIVGHRADPKGFVEVLRRSGELELEEFAAQFVAVAQEAFQEIADNFQSIKDEGGAIAYIKEVVAICEQHMLDFPDLYSVDVTRTGPAPRSNM